MGVRIAGQFGLELFCETSSPSYEWSLREMYLLKHKQRNFQRKKCNNPILQVYFFNVYWYAGEFWHILL